MGDSVSMSQDLAALRVLPLRAIFVAFFQLYFSCCVCSGICSIWGQSLQIDTNYRIRKE